MFHILLALTTASQAGLFKKPQPEPVYVGYKVDLYLCPNNKIRRAGDPEFPGFGTGPIKEPFTRPLGDGGWLLSPETRETCEVDRAVPAVTLYYTRNFRDPFCPEYCVWPLTDAEKTVARAGLREALDFGSPQERAQVAEMLAQEAAARCDAERTDPLTLWVCPSVEPHAPVLDPLTCNGNPFSLRVLPSTKALPFEWDPILPEGADCALTTREEDIEQALHLARWSPIIPDLTRKARAEWEAANEKAEEEASYDCLAGVCLNATVSSIPDRIVTVSEHQWNREVEVCSGRVVSVGIEAGWATENFTWTDIPASAVQPQDRYSPLNTEQRLHSAMSELGWRTKLGSEDLPWTQALPSSYFHPEKKGIRNLTLVGTYTQNGAVTYTQNAAILLTTRHPNKRNLCRAKRQQGL